VSPGAGPIKGVAQIAVRTVKGAREMTADPTSGLIQFGRFSTGSLETGVAAECAIGYRRWEEFDSTNGCGQDAAAVRGDARHLVGVVTDGVSQSFYADIAAGKLTEYLLNLLWERRTSEIGEEDLVRLLRDFEKEVHESVQRHRISPNLETIMVDALEATRLSGSQAVFSAAVIDLARRKLCLYQVGDVDAVVDRGDGTPPRVVTANSSGRWSSAGKSKLLLQITVIEGIEGVVLRSDGAGHEWGMQGETGLDEEGFRNLALRDAGKDDISFVSVRFGSPGRVSRSASVTAVPSGPERAVPSGSEGNDVRTKSDAIARYEEPYNRDNRARTPDRSRSAGQPSGSAAAGSGVPKPGSPGTGFTGRDARARGDNRVRFDNRSRPEERPQPADFRSIDSPDSPGGLSARFPDLKSAAYLVVMTLLIGLIAGLLLGWFLSLKAGETEGRVIGPKGWVETRDMGLAPESRGIIAGLVKLISGKANLPTVTVVGPADSKLKLKLETGNAASEPQFAATVKPTDLGKSGNVFPIPLNSGKKSAQLRWHLQNQSGAEVGTGQLKVMSSHVYQLTVRESKTQ
jgi:hypothetical protein